MTDEREAFSPQRPTAYVEVISVGIKHMISKYSLLSIEKVKE